MNNSPVPVKNIAKRAGVLLTILFLLFITSLSSTLYLAFKSGIVEQKVVTPFKQFFHDLTVESPKPSLTPVVIPSVIPTPSPKPQVQKQPTVIYSAPVAACINKNIREGEFASNKCYLQQDYDDLQYYLNQYNSAVFDKSSAESSMRITCSCRVQQECDFFKDSCDRDKQKQAKADSDINKYRGIVQGIIAKGK